MSNFGNSAIRHWGNVVVVLALAGTLLLAQQAPEQKSSVRRAPDGFSFANGERLVYQAEWRLFNAGTATLEVSSSGGQQHVHGTADATGAVALLYHVQDRFDSWFDTRTLCSARIIKHTEEGLRRKDTQITFDYARNQAVLEETNLRNSERKRVENPIPDCASDVLSGVFYGATLPLTPGEQYTFPLNDGNKTVDVTVHVEAREDVKTPVGIYHTIRVQPEASSGTLQKKGKIWVWYTDDVQHMPVQMRGRMGWGNLTLSLVRIEKNTPAAVSAGSSSLTR